MKKLLAAAMVTLLLMVMTACAKEENPLIQEVQRLEDDQAQLELVGQALDKELLERSNELNGLMEVLLAEKEKLDDKETSLEEVKESFELTRQQLNVMVSKKNARSQLTDDWTSYHLDYQSDKQGAAPLSEKMALTLSKLARSYYSIYNEAYGFWIDEEVDPGIAEIDSDKKRDDLSWFLPHLEYYATEGSFRDYLSKIFTSEMVEEILEDVVTDDLDEDKAFLNYQGRLYTSLKEGTGLPPLYYERLDKGRCLFETYTDTSATVTLIYPTYSVTYLPIEYEAVEDIAYMKETYELEKTATGWRVSGVQGMKLK